MNGQRCGANPLDDYSELFEEEADILDHVVWAGIADNGDSVVAGRGHDDVLGDRVAAFGQDYRRGGTDRFDLGVVEASLGVDVEAKRSQGIQVREHCAGPEITPAHIGQAEFVELMQQGPQEHDDCAGAPRRLKVHSREVEASRRGDLQVIAARQPTDLDPDAGQHLDDPVDLFDAGEATERGAPVVEQRSAQQCHRGVLAGLDVDRPVQLRPADDAQVLGARVTQGDKLGIQTGADASEHLQAQILFALFNARYGALTCAEQLCKVTLGQTLVTSGVPNQRADSGWIVVTHACNHRSKPADPPRNAGSGASSLALGPACPCLAHEALVRQERLPPQAAGTASR